MEIRREEKDNNNEVYIEKVKRICTEKTELATEVGLFEHIYIKSNEHIEERT